MTLLSAHLLACPSTWTRASRGSVFSPIEAHTAQARLWPARCSSQPGGVGKGHAAFGPAPDDEPGQCGVSLWRLSWWEWRGHVHGDQARRRMLLAPGTDGLVVQRTVVCRVHCAWGYPPPSCLPACVPASSSFPPLPAAPSLLQPSLTPHPSPAPFTISCYLSAPSFLALLAACSPFLVGWGVGGGGLGLCSCGLWMMGRGSV